MTHCAPDREAPLFRSDKVGMVILNSQVVNSLKTTSILQSLHCQPTAIRLPRQQVTFLEFARRNPAAVLHPKWMLSRRADLMPGNL